MSLSHPLKPDPLTLLVLELVSVPPVKPYDGAHSCYVPWSVVEALRRELERRRVDWRSVRDSARLAATGRQARWVGDRIALRRQIQALCEHDWRHLMADQERCRKCRAVRREVSHEPL